MNAVPLPVPLNRIKKDCLSSFFEVKNLIRFSPLSFQYVEINVEC